MVLETTFVCETGRLAVTDCMPVTGREPLRDMPPEQELCRVVECTEGELRVTIRFHPTTDYGQPVRIRKNRFGLGFEIRGATCLLRTDFEIDPVTCSALVKLTHGQSGVMSLVMASEGPLVLRPFGAYLKRLCDDTKRVWEGWAGSCTYKGPYRSQVIRSALVLKSLIYAPSGAVVAAPTTSLPERIAGELNWDYRYCWIRDAALTVRALDQLGFQSEARAFASWLLHTTRLTRPRLEPLYDVYGRVIRSEQTLPRLDGYANSRPVRIGNAASSQFQLDVYGEVISAVVQTFNGSGRPDHETEDMLLKFGKFICKNWNRPDEGIWEPRSGRKLHTLSQILCWAGLDRLVRLQEEHVISGKSRARFLDAMAGVRNSIEQWGYDRKSGSFVQSPGDERLDSGILLMGWYGFLHPSEPRMRKTYERIRERLHAGSGLYYRNEQSLEMKEGAFGICGFWAADFLAKGGGTLEESVRQFENVCSFANDVGLFSEEIDPERRDFLGNFPQAFTHIGLINAALSLQERIVSGRV